MPSKLYKNCIFHRLISQSIKKSVSAEMEQKDENNQSKDVVKYRASLQSCRNWNSQLAKNRRSRIPYFDSQTNVDQVRAVICGNITILKQVEIEERTAGLRELSDNISEAYRYPQRRWRRRKDPTSSRVLAENPEHEVTCLPNWKIFEDTPELNDAHMQDDGKKRIFKKESLFLI